jgi:hypothetical protein
MNVTSCKGSLFGVRQTVFGLLLGIGALASGQQLQGTYKVGSSYSASWVINAHSTLMWDGQAYLPYGVSVDPDPASIARAKASGVNDVIVDLPAAPERWASTISALEHANLRYLIRIGSLTPMATGVAVDPAAYRTTEIPDDGQVKLSLPGATAALVVLAGSRDGTIVQWSYEPVTNGVLTFQTKFQRGDLDTLLVYPEIQSLEQPDYWEELDGHRDRLLTALRANPTGPGLRGLVNPLGKVVELPGRQLRFVPTSPAFHSEFAEFLDTRYRSPASAMRAWSMDSTVIGDNEITEPSDDKMTFADLAKLVPLWSGTRGVGQLWDPAHKRIFEADRGRSSVWRDLSEAISDSEAKRYERMVAAIRSVDDVPVIQEWAGWAAPYEGGDPTVDGIGMRAIGALPSDLASTAGRATSSMLRWTTPGWMPATDVDLGSSDAQLQGVLDDLVSLGARGVFVRASSPTIDKQVAEEAGRRSTDISPSTYTPAALFFPINATNPAEAQRITGGAWWLPSPADGDRFDYGNGFFGYRMLDSKGYRFVIWSQTPRRVLLRFTQPSKLKFNTLDGSNRQARLVKNGVEINLSESPLMVSSINPNDIPEIPVPEEAYLSTVNELDYLFAQSAKQNKSLTNVELSYPNQKLSFDRSPGSAFPGLRDMARRMNAFLDEFSWVEAESVPPDENNFSEIVNNPTCSGGRALALRGMIVPSGGYFADYLIQSPSKTDQVVWLAARIPPEDRNSVVLKVAGEALTITGDPVGLYGNGFGWYRMGVTRTPESEVKVRVQVNSAGHDFAMDAILLAQPNFTPDGVFPPEVNAPPATKVKRPKKQAAPTSGPVPTGPP